MIKIFSGFLGFLAGANPILKTTVKHAILCFRRIKPMIKLKYTLKTDTLFKMLFTRYQDLLKRLVAEFISIEYDSSFPVINRMKKQL